MVKVDDFRKAFERYDYNAIKRFCKGDLHIHAGRGCTLDTLKHIYNTNTETRVPEFFYSISDMDNWLENKIMYQFKGFSGYLSLLKSNFCQIANDNVSTFCMSFDLDEILSFKNMDTFIQLVDRMHKKYAPDTIMFPELTLCRPLKTTNILETIENILSYNWFASIDICGVENSQPIEDFEDIYKIAKKYGLILAAHSGEFGSAEDVIDAVHKLQLDRIYHGISIVNSQEALDCIKINNVQLCICPSSNLKLHLQKHIKDHPIAKIFDYNIPVALGSDDMIVTNSTITDELWSLFRNNVLSIEALYKIYLNGVTNFGKIVI